jgi:hypothetical protein
LHWLVAVYHTQLLSSPQDAELLYVEHWRRQVEAEVSHWQSGATLQEACVEYTPQLSRHRVAEASHMHRLSPSQEILSP